MPTRIVWTGPPPRCDTCRREMSVWDPFAEVHTHKSCVAERAARAVHDVFNSIRRGLGLPETTRVEVIPDLRGEDVAW